MIGSTRFTTVTFVRAGVEVASVEVPGQPLEAALPKSVHMHRLDSNTIHLIESSDPLLECCGRLALPWVSTSELGVCYLDVPAPRPFTDENVRTMWEARNRVIDLRRNPTSGDAAWSKLKTKSHDDIAWAALEAAVHSARRLIGSWPTYDEPAVVWRPADRSGGRLLVGVTEQRAAGYAVPAGPKGAPSLTARRTTVRQDRTLHGLAVVATLLARRLSELPALDAVPGIRDSLRGLFRRVAHRSAPRTLVADPPPSTWPTQFAQTYSASLRALSALAVIGPGASHAPLAELWELYETWTADAVRAAISNQLGANAGHDTANTCLGSWQDGSGCIELHYQAIIPAGQGSLSILGQPYRAAIGALSPDLFLVRREDHHVHALVLDAKKRSVEMQQDDTTQHASKYLWGIRRADAPRTVPAIICAVMLTPLGGAVPPNEIGLAYVHEAHPTTGLGRDFGANLLQILRSTDSRPRIDSWPVGGGPTADLTVSITTTNVGAESKFP